MPDQLNEDERDPLESDQDLTQSDAGVSRRDFLKKGALLAYIPPVVHSVYVGTAYAQATSPLGNDPPPPPPDPPNPTSCSPNNAGKGDSLSVTVSGTDFVSGATADFGSGITVNSVTFNSSTSLSVSITISAGASVGPRTVTITNPDLQSGTLIAGFVVNAANPPTVTVCSPSSANRGATLNVTITGTDFVSGATSSFNDTKITVNSTTFFTSTTLVANISIQNGTQRNFKDVTVTNPDLQSDTLVNGFEVT